MIPRGTSIGLSLFRILWTPVHVSFALYVLIWTWDEWNLPALPYHPLLAFFSSIPNTLIVTTAILFFFSALCIGVGWHTRFFQTFLAILMVPLFFHSASTYHNHYAFALFIASFLAMSPTERFFSLDARRMRRSLSPSAFNAWQHQEHTLTGEFFILLQTGFLYLFAALNKMQPEWFWRWTQTPEFSELAHDALLKPVISFLLQYHLLWIPLTGTILLMLFFAVGIFFTRRYPCIALLGIAFHLLLELSLPVILFTPMMISIWLLAMFPAEHPWIRSVEKALSPLPAGEG